MGAAPSHPVDGDTPPKTALHVLRVIPGSPASVAGIQVFFDFIIGIEGTVTSSIDAHSLEQIVESHEGKTLQLNVWNSKYRAMRPVSIIPSRKWALDAMASSQQPPSNPSLLGLSMRLCEAESALEHVWHILEILEGSPAESAGLVPYGDWIVGWSGGVLSKEGDFYEVVEQHEEKPLRVYVYSLDFDTLREVVLVPNRMWGGEGLLGCGVGYGLLHRIPRISATPDDLYEQVDLPAGEGAEGADHYDDDGHVSSNPADARQDYAL